MERVGPAEGFGGPNSTKDELYIRPLVVKNWLSGGAGNRVRLNRVYRYVRVSGVRVRVRVRFEFRLHAPIVLPHPTSRLFSAEMTVRFLLPFFAAKIKYPTSASRSTIIRDTEQRNRE